MQQTTRFALAGLAVSLVVFAMKWAAWVATGSALFFADAAETIINVVAALGALFALWFSAKPADANHPYGHHKVEYISAALEGALMLATALITAHAAWQSFIVLVAPPKPGLGLVLNGLAGALNGVWSVFLLAAGKRHKSPALVASGRHVLSDVYTTLGVMAGFALMATTQWLWLDAAFTGVVAAAILYASYKTLRGSVGALMDEVPDPELVPIISDIILAHGKGALEAHDLRARVVGAITFVEFHLVVPSAMSVKAAHTICDRVEDGLRQRVGRAVVHIHVEPADKAKGEAALSIA